MSVLEPTDLKSEQTRYHGAYHGEIGGCPPLEGSIAHANSEGESKRDERTDQRPSQPRLAGSEGQEIAAGLRGLNLRSSMRSVLLAPSLPSLSRLRSAASSQRISESDLPASRLVWKFLLSLSASLRTQNEEN